MLFFFEKLAFQFQSPSYILKQLISKAPLYSLLPLTQDRKPIALLHSKQICAYGKLLQ